MSDLAAPMTAEIPRETLGDAGYGKVSKTGIAVNLSLGAIGLAFGLPLLWMLLASVDAHASAALRVPDFTMKYFSGLITGSSLDYQSGLQSFKNSLYLAGVATAITTPVALLAAYPLSRRHVPLKRPFLLVLLFATGLPITAVMVPVFVIYTDVNWLNSLTTTALFFATAALPFAIWLIKNGIDAIPLEIEEAAQLEGAGTLQTIVRVIVPLGLPTIAVSAIYTFINAWGAFLIPLVLDSNPGDQPGTVAIYSFIGAHGTYQFGQIAAFSILFSVPVVVLYLIMARVFRGGFTFGGAVH
jgi:multiple sugar transport system permease protein